MSNTARIYVIIKYTLAVLLTLIKYWWKDLFMQNGLWISFMISAPDKITMTTTVRGREGIDHFRKWLHVSFLLQWQILKTIWSLYTE